MSVAVERFLAEKEGVEHRDQALGRLFGTQTWPELGGQPIELGQVGTGVEPRILSRGDGQRHSIELNRGVVVARQQLNEPGSGVSALGSGVFAQGWTHSRPEYSGRGPERRPLGHAE